MRSYLIAMGIRTLSFPAAVWAFVNHHLVLGWILVVLAVLIPSVAVALANAVDHRGESRTSVPLSPVQGLGPAPTAPDDVAGPTTRDDLIVGHVVPGPDEPDDRPRP